MKPFRKKPRFAAVPFEKAALCIETILGHLFIKSSCFIWVAVGLLAQIPRCPLFITF
jgi:hypothetical protein